jgi:hypothetical protein
MTKNPMADASYFYRRLIDIFRFSGAGSISSEFNLNFE